MRRLAWLAAAALMAQSPENVQVDTAQARAVVVTMHPHHPSPMGERRANRILVYLGAGEMTFTSPSGQVEKTVFQAGDVRWSAAGPVLLAENVTSHGFQVVEIELKNRPRPFTPSDLDPLKTDPKHYALELENDQVRVLRVRYGAREKGVRHEHQWNHIVIYLTDHAKGPAGAVKIEGPDVHIEENPLDHPVERIAIDLK